MSGLDDRCALPHPDSYSVLLPESYPGRQTYELKKLELAFIVISCGLLGLKYDMLNLYVLN